MRIICRIINAQNQDKPVSAISSSKNPHFPAIFIKQMLKPAPFPFFHKIPLLTSKPKCTFFLISSLAILTLFASFHSHGTASTYDELNALYLQTSFLTSGNNYTIAKYLHQLTLHPHLAGTRPSIQTALYVKNHFESLGFETHTSNYSVLLSYHVYSSLTAHFSNGHVIDLPLCEPKVLQNGVIKPYHAYSPSGSAYSKPVFLNYGSDQDYMTLATMGVDVNGCIGIVRRGGGSRNSVVEKAAKHGVAAVLMYTEVTGGHGEDFKRGVERGTVMKGLGDPLSPGWAGLEGGESLGVNDPLVTKRFPDIPSMPISLETAETILSLLDATMVPKEWSRSLHLEKIRGIGPVPIMLNFTYQGERKKTAIHNVFSVIRGSEEPDRFVILGNHRDAWTYGAVDPNSGTSALLDIARRFNILKRSGWSPRRTIVFCSWDAEEFGMIGSTEWVEHNLVNLGSKAVAYINVDCAVQGPGFFAASTPQLDDLLIEVTKKVKDPDAETKVLHEKWKDGRKGVRLQRLNGVDSDFAPFLQHAGVPSIDMYFGKDFPVYHTAFDSYEWMKNFGDPLFKRHVAVSGVWGLVALHLADDPILPFNYVSYAAELQDYARTLNNFVEVNISVQHITLAAEELASAATEIQEEVKKLRNEGSRGDLYLLKKRILNDRLMFTERGFLDAQGLQGREWFRHLIYGPREVEDEREVNFFPGVFDAIFRYPRLDKETRHGAIQHEIWRVARAIQRAARVLRGDLV